MKETKVIPKPLEKTCSKCNNSYSLDKFNTNKVTGKVDNYCKICRTEYTRLWYKLNRDNPVYKLKKKRKDLLYLNRNYKDLGEYSLKNALKDQFPYIEITEEMIELKRLYLTHYRKAKDIIKEYYDEWDNAMKYKEQLIEVYRNGNNNKN